MGLWATKGTTFVSPVNRMKVTDLSLDKRLVLLETLMARPGYLKLILNEF